MEAAGGALHNDRGSAARTLLHSARRALGHLVLEEAADAPVDLLSLRQQALSVVVGDQRAGRDLEAGCLSS